MREMGKKVAVGLYLEQMKWVLWYLPIIYVFYFILVRFVNEPEIRSISILTFTFQTATIFMLVCGILSSFVFFSQYVKYGVTRISYFQGLFLSVIFLAITINGISLILAWVISLFNLNLFKDVTLSSFGENSWALTMFTYTIIVMIYYLTGWLVSIAFYRFGGFGGLISVVVAFVIIVLNDLLWEFSTPKPFIGFLQFNKVVSQVTIALAGSIIIAAILTILVYKIIKETPIKVT